MTAATAIGVEDMRGRIAADRFSGRRLALAGVVTLVGALIATLAIRAITVASVNVPNAFTPLKTSSVTVLTILGVLGATFACAALNRLATRPVAAFRRLALAALAVSFVPDIAIWATHAYQHTATAKTVIPLMAMHLPIAAICILVLPAIGGEQRTRSGIGDP
jgi:Family of unknown function (DUF6069)